MVGLLLQKHELYPVTMYVHNFGRVLEQRNDTELCAFQTEMSIQITWGSL